MARTRRVDTNRPGITRKGRGKGFSYHEEDGTRITDKETLDRIRSLAIPPAWSDVWICPHPRGHIQATGVDDAGRKQYRYHDDWRESRDRIKFEEMEEFARALPKLRERIDAGLAERGLVRDRVCSCAIRLLDLGLFRVGSERYENENESYGLTTIKRKHLTIERGVATFDYPGKSGKRGHQVIADPSVIPVLKALKQRRQAPKLTHLLVYREGREWRDLDADDVNAFIKEVAGDGFSAKDFRTWNATVLAAVFLAADEEEPTTRAASKRIVNRAIKTTATYLNNTPAVCRASYIDPRVFDRFEDGETIAPQIERIERAADPGQFPDREKIERAVLGLLA
ncbi:MAG: DNA topoisomerase IB [Solirubrobacterales bacterium]